MSNWVGPVRVPKRPIFNSRTDSRPHTGSSHQKSTLFLDSPIGLEVWLSHKVHQWATILGFLSWVEKVLKRFLLRRKLWKFESWESFPKFVSSQEKADTEWKFARSKLWISYFEEGGISCQYCSTVGVLLNEVLQLPLKEVWPILWKAENNWQVRFLNVCHKFLQERCPLLSTSSQLQSPFSTASG